MTGAEGATVTDLRARNRRVLRVILAVMAALVLASFMVGIRW
jgi:hypothetical protein